MWIYGEALPQRLVSEDEANMLLRGISLSQSEKFVEELFYHLLEEAAMFIEME